MISIGNLQIHKLCLGDVEVTKAYLGDVEVYGSTKKYMTMTVLDGDAGTTISPTITGTLSTNLQYRVNNSSWNDFIVGTTADIHAAAGDVVQFKGNNPSGISNSSSNYLNFAISGNPVSLSGNVMSLIDGVGDALNIPCDYCFYRLFQGSSIKTISPYFLPATTLTNGCYFDLFSGSLLENSPELPALTMQENCYRGMFYGCQHFTQAPELPATTLANSCYAFMLAECSSLVQVPALHATELAQECYRGIFQGCTALTQAPALPATKLANYCYRQMFYQCTSLVQAPALHATTLSSNCYNSMFYGCTSLTQAPELPATTLAEWCYAFMFQGCTALTTAPELPATTLVNQCYNNMFNGCSNLNYVKSLATDITATNALFKWLYGVAASGTFVKPAGVSYETGISGIPSGWTVVEEKPYMTMTVDDSAGETTITPTLNGTLSPNLQYRVNEGNWNEYVFGQTGDIHVVAGDVVNWKGLNTSGLSTSSSDYLNFVISDKVNLSGNIMSLIYNEDFVDKMVIPNNYCFFCLFKGSSIKTVSSDFLPATTLKSDCYREMFEDCKSLVNSPELPATTLADSCYWMMFNRCSNLVKAPEILPATTLKPYCYIMMFMNCSSLVTAPSLTAKTLSSSCYQNMFLGCSNLNYVKSHATDISASNALSNWLLNVAASGTFVKPAGVSYP